MFGYPGAGKTTIAKVIAKLTGAVRLSSDEVRLELFPQPTFSEDEHQKLYDTLNERTADLLRQGQSVIYDANLNRYEHRKEKYDICRQLNVQSVLLWVKTPKELSKTRAVHDSRQHLWPKDETPADMFDRIADVVEEPQSSESYVELDGTQITKDYIAKKLGL
jgi:predicted kinase